MPPKPLKAARPPKPAKPAKAPAASALVPAARRAVVERRTKETDLRVDLAISPGPVVISPALPGFFGHMLNTLSVYAGWSLRLEGKGDLEVDAHHLVEDVGLVLGEALSRSLGDFSGHARFGWALVPMDEALAEASLDAGRRPYLRLDARFPQPLTGDFEL